MAIRTVGELIEELEDYGHHLPVRVGLTTDPEDKHTRPLVIDDRTLDGEHMVLLLPEVQ